MALSLSDQLRRLADRAEEAQHNAAAASAKTTAALEEDRETSRELVQQQAEQLREKADAGPGKVSDWWSDVQRDWNKHIARIKESVEARKAEIDLDRARSHAANAEADAVFAIDFAGAAIGEAEYAVINAELAQKQADELAAGTAASA